MDLRPSIPNNSLRNFCEVSKHFKALFADIIRRYTTKADRLYYVTNSNHILLEQIQVSWY